jgi:hypothetical protein
VSFSLFKKASIPMNSVLAVYDIPQALKIHNPSAALRRFGFRVNLSCWVFPGSCVPTDILNDLKSHGATVHIVEFAEQAQEKILTLARLALREHASKMVKYVNSRTEKIRSVLEDAPLMNDEVKEAWYKKWRSVLNKANRELIAAEQCAMGFSVTGDVSEATNALKSLLGAELNQAITWREANLDDCHAACAQEAVA